MTGVVDPAAISLLGMFGRPERAITYLTPREGLAVVLLQSNHGDALFDVAVARKVGGKWCAYLALHNGPATKVFDRLAEIIN